MLLPFCRQRRKYGLHARLPHLRMGVKHSRPILGLRQRSRCVIHSDPLYGQLSFHAACQRRPRLGLRAGCEFLRELCVVNRGRDPRHRCIPYCAQPRPERAIEASIGSSSRGVWRSSSCAGAAGFRTPCGTRFGGHRDPYPDTPWCRAVQSDPPWVGHSVPRAPR